MNKRIQPLICMSILSLACAGPVLAAETGQQMRDKSPSMDTTGMDEATGREVTTARTDQSEELQNARETVSDAAQVLKQLRAESESDQALKQAKAIFIVPDYGRAALGVGGAGGQGVLVVNNNGDWSGPAFYNIGTINLGLQAGVEAGAVAFLVMSEPALAGFEEDNNFSLNADAGLTIIDWSKRGQLSAGKGADVLVWADTQGLYGNLSVSVTDIFWDDDANEAYYQQQVAASDILKGSVLPPEAETSPLKSEFSALETRDDPGQKRDKQDKEMPEHPYKQDQGQSQ